MAEPLPELDLGQRTAALQRTLAEETQRGLDLHREWVQGLPLPIPSSQPSIDERVADYLANFQRSAEAEAQRTAQRRANERRWAEEARSLYTPPSPDVVAQQQMQASELEQIARATRQRNFSLSQDDVFNRYHPSGTDYEAQQQRDLSSQIERARRNNRDRAASAGNGGGYDGTPNDPPTPPRTPDSSGFRPASIDRSPALRNQQTSGTRAPLDFADPPRTGATASGWDVVPNLPPAPTVANQPQVYRPQRMQNARPSNIPRSAGLGPLARGAAIGGLLDFGIQVAMGEDPRRAAASATGGAIGSTIGTGIGASIGAAFGGVGAIPGGIIGGIVGGTIGGLAGGGLYNSLFPPPFPLPNDIPQRTFTTIPFRGGQMEGAVYSVTVVQKYATYTETGTVTMRGRIIGTRVEVTQSTVNGRPYYTTQGLTIHNSGASIAFHGGGSDFSPISYQLSLTNVRRIDGQPDTGGDRYEPAPTVLIPVGRQHAQNSPVEQYYPNPVQTPQNGQGNSPFWIPANRPAPGITPVGDPTPRPVPQPQFNPNTRTVTPQQPYAQAIPFPQSRTTTFTVPAPESQYPDDTAPDNQLFPPALPALAPTVRPTPQPQPQPSSIPPTTPPNVSDPCQGNACSQAIRSDIANNRSRLDELNAALNAADLAGLQALMAKLNQIDNKLGAQVPGGLSGFLQGFREKFDKFVKWTQIDRVLNLLTFIAAVHNAFMLSNQIGQTLTSAISQGLAVIGIKDEDGNELDINSIIGNAVENTIKSIVGEENYETMSAQWKRANRIYQSAANILFAFQSITYSILESLEIVGSYVAKIGNAAKKFGVFVENCYAWMNPNPDFTRNRFFRFLDTTQETVENIDEVAGEVLNIQETIVEIESQSEQLRQAVAGIDENGQPYPTGLEVPEHTPTFDLEILNSESSQSPPISESDERAPVEAGAS